MNQQIEQLEVAIETLQRQRALLGDGVVDMAIAPLRAQLIALRQPAQALQTAPEQVLKQVTILFLDVVGSTVLSQLLDPEAVSQVMDRAMASFRDVIVAQRGKVLKYAGDSVLAVFGADGSAEDDPQRAVRVGLALLEEGRLQGQLVLAEQGHAGFNVRVGLHTGDVLLGGGVDGVNSIRGFHVNVAARMEQSAPAGTLRISHETYQRVRGLFDVDQQPPIEVKGVDMPMMTYLVQRAKPRTFRLPGRGIDGVQTRMVGRDAELEQLQDSFMQLVQPQAKMQAVAVVGEPGLGKSRLLHEFGIWVQDQGQPFSLLQGRATQHMTLQPYGLLRDVLAWRLQIQDSDSMDTAKRKLEDGIAPLFLVDEDARQAQAHAHLLGHLVGLDFSDSPHIVGIKDDPRQIRNRGFHAAAQAIKRIAGASVVNDNKSDSKPMVLMLDDLHWADNESLEFLTYLAQVNRDMPLLVLALARPTLFERDKVTTLGWFGSGQRIVLNPLDQVSSRTLVPQLLGKLPRVPANLRDLITDGAHGNPYFMEELVSMLINDGTIVVGREAWHLMPDKLKAFKVPSTLTGIVQARLDSLPLSEQQALQTASVIGINFWDHTLLAVSPQAALHLASLSQRDLIRPEDTRQHATHQNQAQEYFFKNPILHQVTYDTVLKAQRRDTHAKVAAWFATAAGARSNDFLALAAEHYLRAGDHDKALNHFARAAQHALECFANETALGYLEQALALMPEGDSVRRWPLIASRERALDRMGRRTAQMADIDFLLGMAEQLNDDTLRAEAAFRRCDIAMRTGDFATQEVQARRAQSLASSAGSQELALLAQHHCASALEHLGNGDAATALALQGLSQARVLGSINAETRFVNFLGNHERSAGDGAAAMRYYQQGLGLSRTTGDRMLECALVGNIGSVYLSFGMLKLARQHTEDGLRLSCSLGVRSLEGNALNNLSALHLQQHDAATALTYAQAALDVSMEIESRMLECVSLLSLADAELELGRYAHAGAAFNRSATLAQTLALPDCVRYAVCGQARLAMSGGDDAVAVQAVERLVQATQPEALIPPGNVPLFNGDNAQLMRVTAHKVWLRARDPRARMALAEATPNFRRGQLRHLMSSGVRVY